MIANELNKGEFYRKVAHKLGIKYKVYVESSNRILFHNSKKSNYLNEINGSVFEKINGNFEQVCWPLPGFSSGKVDLNENYLIFPIHDGTVINKYFSKLEQKWFYGTRCSSDILRETWRGHKYEDILKRFFKDDENLDKNKTYIYVLICPEFHYLKDDLKLIATNKGGNIEYLETPIDCSLFDIIQVKGCVLRGKKNYLLENQEQENKRILMYEPLYSRNVKSMNYAKKRNNLPFFVEAKCYLADKKLKYFGEYTERPLECFEILDRFMDEFCEYIMTKKEESNYVNLFDDFLKYNQRKIEIGIKNSNLKSILLQIKEIVFLLQECLRMTL